ncbi:MAG: signal peptide peptidase SppA [Deltaproteobacteria bacterium]|nr:signal peptide peptidase SppA [Deltaproteobacteria bacterium]
MIKRFFLFAAAILFIALFSSGCVSPRVNLFSRVPEPFKEQVMSGTGPGKILVIPVSGIISDSPKRDMFQTRPGMVQDIVAQLDLAAKDPEIKAVLLKINSPGGTVTASDILYHEIMTFKEKTGDKVVAMMMNVAASGGYYIALPADYIMAHPTTVTGSVGVIFMRPRVVGLMSKIGVGLEVNTSGKNKDMGSPFRPATEDEKKLFQNLTDKMGKRFISLVEKRRRLDPDQLEEVATARIYLAADAVSCGLVDRVGYIDDAVAKAKDLAGLPEQAQVVVYRRTAWPDDNIYNSQQMLHGVRPTLIDIGLPASITQHLSGFCYIWASGIETN